MPEHPRPHRDSLIALFANPELPDEDKKREDEVFDRYNSWVKKTIALDISSKTFISDAVCLLNKYKNFIDLDFTVDGFCIDQPPSWLSRQKGQTKHSATVMEEFLPLITLLLLKDLLPKEYSVGPAKCILSFDSIEVDLGLSLNINQKDVDFAIYTTKNLIKSKYNLAVFALELKDHVDKTMMNGTIREASLYKQTFPNGFYGLVAGWRDLGPTAYQPLDGLDCFTLLRKARRIGAPRSSPKKVREHWKSHPYQAEVFSHLISHLTKHLTNIKTLKDIDCLTSRINSIDAETIVDINHSMIDKHGWVH